MVQIVKSWIEGRAEKKRLTRNRITLEENIHWHYVYHPEAQRNNQYIIDNVVGRDDVYELLKNPDATKQSLVDKLNSIPHTPQIQHLGSYPPRPSDPTQVYNLTHGQLLRIYLLVNDLESQEFNACIGSLAEEALNDLVSEHGGLVLFDATGRLTLHPIENVYENVRGKIEQGHKPDKYKIRVPYLMPPEAWSITNLASYHFHIGREDPSTSVGPSNYKPPFKGGDIKACELGIITLGESHKLVVTKLKGQNFNIYYYGGDRKGNEVITVLDLGNYTYMKK